MPSVLNRKDLGRWQELGQTNTGFQSSGARPTAGKRVTQGRAEPPRGQPKAALRNLATMWPAARLHTGPDTRPQPALTHWSQP